MRENSRKDQKTKKRFDDFLRFVTPRRSHKGGRSNRRILEEQSDLNFARQGTVPKSGPIVDFAAARTRNAGDPMALPAGFDPVKVQQLVDAQSQGTNPLLRGIDILRQGFPTAPAPAPPAAVSAPAAHAGGDDYLGMQLAALGGGPDRGTYIRPFDEAEGRVREAHTQALPVIAKAYDDLRGQLSTGQQNFAAEQARIAAEQQARSGQLADRVRSLQAPAAADAAAQAGGNLAPSLAAGLQAQAAQNEANLTDAQRRQAAFLENLARTQEQSSASRLAGTQGAQMAAELHAGQNLNNILGQLDLQRSAAEQRYTADARAHGQERVGVIAEYARREQQEAKEAERAQLAEAKEVERQRKDEDKLVRRIGETGAVFGSFAKANEQLRRRWPRTFRAVGDLIGVDYEPGELGRAAAHGVIDAHEADFTGDYAVDLYGARLDPAQMHRIVDIFYDQERAHLAPFLRVAK